MVAGTDILTIIRRKGNLATLQSAMRDNLTASLCFKMGQTALAPGDLEDRNYGTTADFMELVLNIYYICARASPVKEAQ